MHNRKRGLVQHVQRRFKETFMKPMTMSFVLLAGLVFVACDQQVQQTGVPGETVSAAFDRCSFPCVRTEWRKMEGRGPVADGKLQ
jgi:hypothetical protein